jgi:hypothetical protein
MPLIFEVVARLVNINSSRRDARQPGISLLIIRRYNYEFQDAGHSKGWRKVMSVVYFCLDTKAPKSQDQYRNLLGSRPSGRRFP